MSDSQLQACTVRLSCASHADRRPRPATAAPPTDASARVRAGARAAAALAPVGGDGLPLLPCHARRSVGAVFPDTAAARRSAGPPPRTQDTLDELGERATRASVRASLLGFYEHTGQLDAATDGVSEMTLRIDTELELLRRQCFAERNAQWGGCRPEQLAFAPVAAPAWTPQPMNGKHAVRLLREDGGGLFGAEKKDAASTLTGAAAASVAAAKKKREKYDFPVGELARERPWPPEEFALKPHSKPSRARTKRKHAAALAATAAEDKRSMLAKSCVECLTQSTPLWRAQTRQRLTTKLVVVQSEDKTPSSLESFESNVSTVAVAGESATLAPTDVTTEEREVAEDYQVDVCLACFLKLERSHLFEKKRVNQKHAERDRRQQTAQAALQEKKRLKQQIHQLKKQQKQLKQQTGGASPPEEQPTAAVATGREEAAPVLITFTREEIAAAEEARKKERKRTRKDKKKKKKRRRSRYEDSESDGLTPMPSPPQMEGFEYADRAPEPYTTPSTSAFDAHEAVDSMAEREEPEASDSFGGSAVKELEATAATGTRTSSRTRKSVKRATSPARTPSSPRSKKRKSAPSGAKSPSTRSSRPKRAASAAAPVAPEPVAVAVTPAPPTRKRGRSKKELARERELRALGQYCPVCSEVYEEDDESTFVCCDSCELWVHGACDPTLSPEIIAALAESSDKYICPLCAGR